MKNIAILTSSFAIEDISPLERLRKEGCHIVLNPHGRKVTADEVLHLAGDCEGILSGLEDLNSTVLQNLKKLRVISRCGVGLDNVDLEAAKKMGILVFNTPDAVAPAVAELTIGVILDLLRKITASDRDLKKKIWKKKMGELLRGKKVGIVGFGRIGRRVAELAAVFGATISYCDTSEIGSPTKVLRQSFDELLASSDILTLHCSASRDAKPLIGAKELERMKKNAYLINVSRGGLIDETALASALNEGRLSGAALDAFSEEPYEGPLLQCENIVLTPHIGSYAKECRVRMEMEAAENLILGLKC